MPVLTLIFDETSIRMPVSGGHITLYMDGTSATHGPVSPDQFVPLFAALDAPEGGRVWWKVFVMSTIFRQNESDAERLRHLIRIQPNEWSIIRCPKLADWIRSEELHRVLSVSTFMDAKAFIWDHAKEEPINSSRATRVLNFVRTPPSFPSRKAILEKGRQQGE